MQDVTIATRPGISQDFALTPIDEGNVRMLQINALNVGNPNPIDTVIRSVYLRGMALSHIKDQSWQRSEKTSGSTNSRQVGGELVRAHFIL